MKKTLHLFISLAVVVFISCERNELFDLARGGGASIFVAVGDGGNICYSGDGVDWSDAVSPVTENLYGITWAEERFVAVGNFGTVVTSKDGKNWTGGVVTGSVPLYCVACGEGTCVAAGQWMSLHVQVRTSNDGSSWNDHSISISPGHSMRGIAYGNGRFYMAGDNFSGWYSDDFGITWTASNQIGSNYWGVVYANNKFTVVGAGGMIRESPSALTGSWVNANTGTSPAQILAITHGNGRYVIVGSAGDSAWSSDGTVWNLVNTGTANTLNAVIYGNGRYVAAGDAGTLVYSPDGTGWTCKNISSQPLRGVAYRP